MCITTRIQTCLTKQTLVFLTDTSIVFGIYIVNTALFPSLKGKGVEVPSQMIAENWNSYLYFHVVHLTETFLYTESAFLKVTVMKNSVLLKTLVCSFAKTSQSGDLEWVEIS